MKTLSIRARLTAWYSALLAVVLVAFAIITFEAMRVSVLAAADDELKSRVDDTRQMMRGGFDKARSELAQHGSDIFRFDDARGAMLYESPAARRVGFVASTRIGIDTQRVGGESMRVVTTPMNGTILRMAIPLRPYEQAIARFGNAILIAIPIALVIAAAGGYWLSGHALRPVDRITQEARTITAQNLDRRLPLPAARDELRLLSETLNAMLDRLEDSFHRVAQFTADASHELRTPVALIRTTAEVALRRPREDAEYRDALQQVLSESERVSHLIEDLLLLARSDAGTDALEKTRVDLGSPLRDALERIDRDVEQSIDDGIVVEGNAASLQQLFGILLDNAAKFSEGAIAVSLHARDGAAIADVRDRGVGIAADDLPHIFERFYRADKSRHTPGSGLGLAIAKRIAEIHGGTIRAVSEPGAGSTFTVTLPRFQETFSRGE